MVSRAVELRVGGQTYRVVSSASPEELLRLAEIVDERIHALVPPGRPVNPQTMLLAAMALAHDLEEQRAKTAQVVARARDTVGRMLTRLDTTIAATEAALGTPDDGET
jgi:cell division protein ZapA